MATLTDTENQIHFIKCTQSVYDSISEVDENAIYWITDTGKIYLGSISMNTSDSIEYPISVQNGGTGATTASDARNALGAAASSHNHAASEITSGTLSVARGGTGSASHTSNAVLTGNGTGAVKNVATASGALYATAANGAATFGTLPVAQGGTGATTADNARKALSAAGWKLLWNNSSPSTAHGSKSVTVSDASSYDYYLIIYRPINSSSNAVSQIVRKSTGGTRLSCIIPNNGGSASVRSRLVTFSGTSFTFDTGYMQTLNGTSSSAENTGSSIPVFIIGIKSGTVES